MTVENEEKVAPAEGSEKVTPPAKEPVVEAKPPKATKVEAKVEPAGDGKSEPKGIKVLGDDDDIPENEELFQLSKRALDARLTRADNARLKERFGTTDVAAIKKKLEKLETYEADAEEKRRKALDKEARMQEDLDAATARADAAETRATQLQRERVVDTEDGRLKGIAEKHIKPKYWRHVSEDLREHLNAQYTPKDLAKLTDKDLGKWFADYVKENPEYAKGAAGEKVEPETAKVGLHNGARVDGKPAPASKDKVDKTFKPGQANSMSSADARAAAAKEGIRWT